MKRPEVSDFFSNHDTCDIAERIGIPIFTRRCTASPKGADLRDTMVFGEVNFNNPDATFLHLCLDPNAKSDPHTGTTDWSGVPHHWRNSAGSAIVVCQDKKPLLPLHVEALCKYCQFELHTLFLHTLGGFKPEESIGKNETLSLICRASFLVYWRKFTDEKLGRGENVNVRSPYVM
jgi:hypothetical protein